MIFFFLTFCRTINLTIKSCSKHIQSHNKSACDKKQQNPRNKVFDMKYKAGTKMPGISQLPTRCAILLLAAFLVQSVTCTESAKQVMYLLTLILVFFSSPPFFALLSLLKVNQGKYNEIFYKTNLHKTIIYFFVFFFVLFLY